MQAKSMIEGINFQIFKKNYLLSEVTLSHIKLDWFFQIFEIFEDRTHTVGSSKSPKKVGESLLKKNLPLGSMGNSRE